ncbi:hypothetical protein ACFL0W_03930 [Nanoarchaeota archaeon]
MRNTENSTKKLIIQILGDRFPLTLKQIYIEIKKEKDISYQAVHKVIKEIVEDGIVDKIEKQYFLNKNWIKQQTKSFSNYYSNYFNIGYNPNQIDESSKIQIFRFTSLKDLTNFLIKSYAKGYFGENEPKKIFLSVRRLLPFVPESIIHFIKKLEKENKICLACRGNTIADKLAAKFFRSLGIEVKTGVVIPHHNSICIGDTVLQYFFFFNEPYRKKLYSFSDKIKKKSGFSLLKMTSDIFHRQTEIYIIVNKHSVLVEDIKQSISDVFE